MSGPPRPKLPSRAATMGSHSPSPPQSSSSSNTTRQASVSISEGSGESGTASGSGTDLNKSYIPSGNERVFPLRSVVHARPSLHRRKIPGGGSFSGGSSSVLQPSSPSTRSVARSPKPPPAPVRPRAATTMGSEPRLSSPYLPQSPTGGAFEWFPPAGDNRSPSEAGMPMRTMQSVTMDAENGRPEPPPPPMIRPPTRVITSAGEYWIRKGEIGLEEEAEHRGGIIQSFACLLALAEDEEGRFIVQQVSDNSLAILGHSPSAIFATPSFTTLLDVASTDIFLDAVDALDDNDSSLAVSDDDVDSPAASGEDQPEPATKALPPPEHFTVTLAGSGKVPTRLYAALHRPDPVNNPSRLLLELEPEVDEQFPLSTSWDPTPPERSNVEGEVIAGQGGLKLDSVGDGILRSAKTHLKGLKAMARRRSKRAPEINLVQLVFQIESELRRAASLDVFLAVTAAIFKEVTGFDHVMVLQFDDEWNASTVAEDVDRTRWNDVYLDLTFPASSIPSASLARSPITLVYDVDGPQSVMCARSAEEVENPVDMTRCAARAPPVERLSQLKDYNTRSTMSISLFAFNKLWGVVRCSSAGPHGHRVSVPIRNLCTYLGESLSRTIERLSFERRLQARRIINTSATTEAPIGHIIASGDELLQLFGADWGCLSVGEEAKILGEVGNATELLSVLEYLREARYTSIQMSAEISTIFPSCHPPDPSGFKQVSGILVIPLSPEGKDLLFFARLPQQQEIKWVAPNVSRNTSSQGVEVWRQRFSGRSRPWSDEVLDTAEVLGTIYSRFISVWREKESYVQANSVTSLLLANASHEVRTPLNAIVNFLELAMDASEGGVVNEHLQNTRDASRALTHVINDLLDLTRHESGTGGELFLSEAFDLRSTIEDAISIQQLEASRRGLKMEVIEDPQGTPSILLGDRSKIRQIISTVVGNAVKYTETGGISIRFGEIPDDDPKEGETVNLVDRKDSIRISITIEDTGRGIEDDKLEALFTALHHVKQNTTTETPTIGLGLAATARIVENLSGQLRVESEVGKGSRFQFIIPLAIPEPSSPHSSRPSTLVRRTSSSGGSRESLASRDSSTRKTEIDSLISAISSAHLDSQQRKALKRKAPRPRSFVIGEEPSRSMSPKSSRQSLRSLPPAAAMTTSSQPLPAASTPSSTLSPLSIGAAATLPPLPSVFSPALTPASPIASPATKSRAALKILVVEDEKINATLIERRLKKDSHFVTVVQHGAMAVRAIEEDPTYDIILMDLNMPICDGYEASSLIRKSEPNYVFPAGAPRPPSHLLNRGIPIIAVTANSQERLRDQLITSGIDGWCLKPVRFDRLTDIMMGALDQEQRRKDLYKPGEWERGGWLHRRRQKEGTGSSTASQSPVSPSAERLETAEVEG